MRAVRIYRDGTCAHYGNYSSVQDFRKAYDAMEQWAWVANALEGYAGGSYHHQDGSYITLVK